MDPLAPIPGEDPAFLDALEHLGRVAQIERSCLVVGERGAGKELFATRLHYLSPRWDRAVIKVNCAALAETLLESELFGHEAGAFTGATRRHQGCFERADGGTLILDEIASASLAVQEKLLRVVEYGEFQRVGGRDVIDVDVRVVGASNVDLPTAAARGEFRWDLLDRLAFDVVTIPPLRARPADILPLAEGFAMEMVRALGRDLFPGFSAAAAQALERHAWPGNVRELKNVVERAVYLSAPDAESVDVEVFDPFASPWRPTRGATGSVPVQSPEGLADDPPRASRSVAPDRLSESPAAGPVSFSGSGPVVGVEATDDFTASVAAYERLLLTNALRDAAFNRRVAAERLGLGYQQLRRLLVKHALRPDELTSPN
ncbi:MAG: phage shock protein operon transcriptional activator [Pseudomonadota bacterium]